ncbi:unnamed protein product [Hermetia illucens]|uniref:Cytochrome P450 n=1 Tax=Hermetia illucens TaxID=343691 RepID=A0A7R8UEZ4_HERIL|nr:probable cytochrome P450 6a14 [Hermetia illucens]CAD7079541.1 unnamed protein product [Hermetia illucens]
MNCEIQGKARQEIEGVLNRHNGEVSYEAMMGMRYLDCIIFETLRKYSMRMANKDYCVPNSDKKIPKGMRTLIPVYSIHHDPDIYPNPEILDPNRFTSEKKRKRHSM